MFFSKKQPKPKPEDTVLENMRLQKEEIKRRLETASKVDNLLKQVAAETQQMASNLSDKIKKETKLARRMYLQISKKLKEAVLIVDGDGKIIRLNAAGEKLFGVAETEVLGEVFSNVVATVNPVTEKGKPLEFALGFFSELSEKVLVTIATCKQGENIHGACNDCIGEIVPEYIYPDRETLLKVTLPCLGKTLKLNVMFSILDNDPENMKEVTYVFIFTKA